MPSSYKGENKGGPASHTDSPENMASPKLTTVSKSVQISAASTPVSSKSRNAFAELMAPKIQKQLKASSGPRLQNPNSKGRGDRRDALGTYASNPNSLPKELLIYDTKEFLVVKDLYPKSSVHTLLLFRHPENTLHPFHFFEDADILAKAREEVKGIRSLVAAELGEKYGKFSKQDEYKQKVLRGETKIAEDEELPKGRNWESEVMIGVHARPSMNHVHVHILSKDRFSPCMKTRNHYQSFNTPFFVELEDFPLAPDDPRWDSNATNGYIREDFRCWRCQKTGFKNFPDLKRHLAEEFSQWKAE